MDLINSPEIYTEPWIYWLQATTLRVEETKRWHSISSQDLPIGEKLVQAVLEELPAAMQAISSAAFAVDGFDGAVADIVSLPKIRGSRARAIVGRLSSAIELPPDELNRHLTDLGWLFRTRNKSVHGKVWKDPAWKHPSGLSVSASQREFSLKSAERALGISQAFIGGCLDAARGNPDLAAWAAMRRARMSEFLVHQASVD